MIDEPAKKRMRDERKKNANKFSFFHLRLRRDRQRLSFDGAHVIQRQWCALKIDSQYSVGLSTSGVFFSRFFAVRYDVLNKINADSVARRSGEHSNVSRVCVWSVGRRIDGNQ